MNSALVDLPIMGPSTRSLPSRDDARRASALSGAPRTGPIGRLARLAWLAVFVVSLASIVDTRGPARFRDPHILGEPSVWVLHLLMVVVFLAIVGTLVGAAAGPRWASRAQIIGVAGLALFVVLAGAYGQITRGSVWGFPLADGVWIFDAAMLAAQSAAFILAIVLGTPGCEIGVWLELVARARGDPVSQTTGLACVVGLEQLDRWEASRKVGHPA